MAQLSIHNLLKWQAVKLYVENSYDLIKNTFRRKKLQIQLLNQI